MKFEEAAKIIHELLDSKLEQICSEENAPHPWIYCSYSANGKWDMYINRKHVVYRQYYRDILFEVRKASQRKVLISRIDVLEFKEFLKDQIRLAQKAKSTRGSIK